MLKFSADPKPPQEIRARRVRAIFLSLFSTLIVLLLLAVAWAGTALRQRTPSSSLVLTEPAQGTLTFDLPTLARVTALQLTGDDQSAVAELVAELDPHVPTLLHSRGQVYFVEVPNVGVRWFAWLPTRRPQRISHEQIARSLGAGGLFLPYDSRQSNSPVGIYQSRRQGFLIGSERPFPPHSITTKPVSGSHSAEYDTTVDLVPSEWLAAIPAAQAERIDAGVVSRVIWFAPDGKGSPGRVVFLLDGGEEVEAPWFNPLLPGKSRP